MDRLVANGVIKRTIRFADEALNQPPQVVLFDDSSGPPLLTQSQERLEIETLPVLPPRPITPCISENVLRKSHKAARVLSKLEASSLTIKQAFLC